MILWAIRHGMLTAALVLAVTGHGRAATPVHAVAPSDPPAQAATLAPGWVSRYWNVADGLPQNTINGFVTQPTGDMWLATFGGLVRFDGFTFETLGLTGAPTLPSIRITAIETDGHGGLWLGTQDGDVVHLVNRRVVSHQRLEPLNVSVASIVRAGSEYWLGRGDGPLFHLSGDRWAAVPLPEDITGSRAGPSTQSDASIAPPHGNDDGSIWTGFQGTVVRIDADGRAGERHHVPGNVLAIERDRMNRLWIGTTKGLMVVAGRAAPRHILPAVFSGRAAPLLADDRFLWAGHDSQIESIDLDTLAPVDAKPVLSVFGGVSARVIGKDTSGNVWVGTNGAGLCRLRPRGPALFAGREVTAISGDGAGGVLVAGYCSGLYQVPRGTMLVRSVPLPPRSSPCVWAALQDRRGRLWLGTSEGLVVARGSATVPADLRRLPRLQQIVEAADGTIWLGSSTGDVFSISVDGSLRSLKVGTAVSALATAADGSVWIGTDQRLIRYAQGRLNQWGRDQGLPPGQVRCLLPRPDGSVWIATYGGGLARWEAGRITRVNGLGNSSLSWIEQDRSGRLWLSSNLGLQVDDEASLKRVADTQGAVVEEVVLGPETGIPEATSGAPGGWTDADGRLWFATISGALVVTPTEWPASNVRLRPTVVRASVDGRPLPETSSATVPPDALRLTVTVGAIELTSPVRILFRHRLDGFDADWSVPSSDRDVEYSRLPPGDYLFRVAARDAAGVWSQDEGTLAVTVVPAWHERWWVRGAGLLAAFGSVGAFILQRTRRIKAHNMALRREIDERERARQQAATLRSELEHVTRVATAGELASSLAHELNQPLSAIASNAQAARRYLAGREDRRDLVAQILEDISRQAQRASSVITSLRKFLGKTTRARERLSLNALITDTMPLLRSGPWAPGVAFEFSLGPSLPLVYGNRVQLQQIILNIVNNACEATASNAVQRRVVLRTRRTDASVILECHDNGPGIGPEMADRLFEPFATSKPTGMGLGLAICRSLVDAHGGRIWHQNLSPGLAVIVEFPIITPEEPA